MTPPVGGKPPIISTGTAQMAQVGVPPAGGQPAAVAVPTMPTTPGTSGTRTPWLGNALWRMFVYPALSVAGVLLSPEAKFSPPMTDAEANVWQLPEPLRDLKLGIDRTAAPSQLRTQWNDLLRTDFASPPNLREQITAVFRHIDSPHSALALTMILYNRAVHAGWSAAQQDTFIEILQLETAAVLGRFNTAMDTVRSEDAALFTAGRDTTRREGNSTSTGRPLRAMVTIPAGFTYPRPSAWKCQDGGSVAGPCELATIYGQSHATLLQALMAERDPLAVLFEDYLAWAESAGVPEKALDQARGDYVRLFQRVFSAHVKKLADDLHTDDIELRLAAMHNEFRHESRGVWQAFTDQLQFWRMAGDRGEVGHFLVLLLLLDGAFMFGGAFRRSRLEARLVPVRMRVDLAQRLVGEAQERASRADQHLRQLIATRSAFLSHGDDGSGQGQHKDPWTEIDAARQESESAAAELADRRRELEDAIAAVMGDDPKRQHRARLLWRATQRTGEFARYQLPWGLAFAVVTALILAPIQVASNGDPIPLLDAQSRASWRVK